MSRIKPPNQEIREYRLPLEEVDFDGGGQDEAVSRKPWAFVPWDLGFENPTCLRVEFALYPYPEGNHEQTPLIVPDSIGDEKFLRVEFMLYPCPEGNYEQTLLIVPTLLVTKISPH